MTSLFGETALSIDPWFLVAVCTITFVVSMAATLAGFGLGVTLTPIFALVYPTQLAVMLVAVVHFLNNLFRLGLFRKHFDRDLVRRFGVLCVAGAFIGSFSQGFIQSDWLKVVMGVLLLFLGGVQLIPGGKGWHFPRRFDRAGGLIAGTMGGLVGSQGPIVAGFLVNYSVPKEVFVATSTLITVSIDAARVPVYLWTQWDVVVVRYWPLLLAVTACGYLGTYLGRRLVHGISQASFRSFVNGLVAIMGAVMIGQGASQAVGAMQAAGITFAVLLTLASLGFWLSRTQAESHSSVAVTRGSDHGKG
jgi:uncharacterized protein